MSLSALCHDGYAVDRSVTTARRLRLGPVSRLTATRKGSSHFLILASGNVSSTELNTKASITMPCASKAIFRSINLN